MAARELDVLCLGEALVDFLPERAGAPFLAKAYRPCPGGAPANVATGLARLGLRVGFFGATGDDPFGRFLAERLVGEGISSGLRVVRDHPTGLWFVTLDERGDRGFFSPNARISADKYIGEADVAEARLGRATWLHLGSSAHVLKDAQEALRLAVHEARRQGTRVSFDPNVRAHLWEDLEDCARLCREVIPLCDLVKLSADEVEICTGEREPERAARALVECGVGLAVVTRGEEGAILRRGNFVARIPAIPAAVVDTTGAGDAFLAGVLAKVVHSFPDIELDEDALIRAGSLGARMAARVVACPGAVAGLPRRGEISV